MNTTIDITLSSPQIQYLCQADSRLAVLIQKIGPISYALDEDPFCFLVETIINQMVSKKVGDVFSARLNAKCGGGITVDSISGLTWEDLRAVGLSGSKAKYILNLAEAVAASRIDFNRFSSMTDNEIIESLTSLSGIGVWSAKMYLTFVLGREDILPYEDMAFMQSYNWLYEAKGDKKADIIRRCGPWKPFSSYAARYLYRALDTGLTKQPFGDLF